MCGGKKLRFDLPLQLCSVLLANVHIFDKIKFPSLFHGMNRAQKFIGVLGISSDYRSIKPIEGTAALDGIVAVDVFIYLQCLHSAASC